MNTPIAEAFFPFPIAYGTVVSWFPWPQMDAPLPRCRSACQLSLVWVRVAKQSPFTASRSQTRFPVSFAPAGVCRTYQSIHPTEEEVEEGREGRRHTEISSHSSPSHTHTDRKKRSTDAQTRYTCCDSTTTTQRMLALLCELRA